MKYSDKNKFVISFLVISSSLLFLSGCNNKTVFQKGEIEPIQKESQEYKSDEAELYRNKKTGRKIQIEQKNSWYYDNILSERSKFTYSELMRNISDMNKEMVLTQKISEDELIRIMNIIYFDSEDSFGLKYTYSYELDENKNVNKVFLDYVYTKERVNEIKENVKNQKISFIKNMRELTDIDASDQIIEKISTNLSLPLKEDIKGSPINSFSTLASFESNSGRLSLANAHEANLLFRSVGIESFTKIGVLTDNGLNTKNPKFKSKEKNFKEKVLKSLETPTFKNTQNDQILTKKTDGPKTTITIHVEKVYAWNCVKIDGKWLNIDPYYDFLASTYYDTTEYISSLSPDFLISASRMFTLNESIFGVTPSSESIEYTKSVRDKSYILDKDMTEMILFLQKEMEDNLKNKKESYYHQFENKETMSLYIRLFNKAFRDINKKTQNSIIDYQLNTDPSRLLVEIKSIRYSV